MVKVGLLGAGQLGKVHLKCLAGIGQATISGFYDPDESLRQMISREFGVPSYPDLDTLFQASDALDIVSPTNTHAELASKALRAGKHLFIEKPVVQTIEEARMLTSLAQEANMMVQVGHAERFNPAFVEAKKFQLKPQFIESQRVLEYSQENNTQHLVFDVLIHDIDIALHLAKSNVSRVIAHAVNVVGNEPDIINVRLEFDNGCVANLTANRIAKKNKSISSYYQKDACFVVDFQNKTIEKLRPAGIVGTDDFFDGGLNFESPGHSKNLEFNKIEIINGNAIQMELDAFIQSILTGSQPPVTLEDGVKALKIAYQILDQIAHKQ